MSTVVEHFAQRHAAGELDSQHGRWRDLLPLSAPPPGAQYAFEVDLDACSGCKACVAACHQMNGLDEGETWRSVGLLVGGSDALPVLQHVTTACHHCIEPACLEGCPVNAYEKDAATGIVRHLDDQCIGCQYCIFKCPYDVPKYHAGLGIVRKCDMCRQRLVAGEPPACVAACPNRAIRVTLVDQAGVVEQSEANLFLPGAPEPGYTLPTTIYKTARPLPRNLLPADYYTARPQHAHLPLVAMLVLTQMSVGAFAVEQFAASLLATGGTAVEHGRPLHLAAALVLGLVGIAASVAHLGRPWYAFRAVLGLRRSWLSREIVAFGLFALLAIGYTASAWLPGFSPDAALPAELSHDVPLPNLLPDGTPLPVLSSGGARLHDALGAAAALVGLAAVACSVMVYADTRRPFWSGPRTAIKFFGTAAVLGLPVALLIALASAALDGQPAVRTAVGEYARTLCRWLALVAALKLLAEAGVFFALRHKQHTPLKRTAVLLAGELGVVTLKRFFVGTIGGILLPLLLAAEQHVAPAAGFAPLFVAVLVVLILMLLVLGELLERYLFFTAVVAPKMPGSPAS